MSMIDEESARKLREQIRQESLGMSGGAGAIPKRTGGYQMTPSAEQMRFPLGKGSTTPREIAQEVTSRIPEQPFDRMIPRVDLHAPMAREEAAPLARYPQVPQLPRGERGENVFDRMIPRPQAHEPSQRESARNTPHHPELPILAQTVNAQSLKSPTSHPPSSPSLEQAYRRDLPILNERAGDWKPKDIAYEPILPQKVFDTPAGRSMATISTLHGNQPGLWAQYSPEQIADQQRRGINLQMLGSGFEWNAENTEQLNKLMAQRAVAASEMAHRDVLGKAAMMQAEATKAQAEGKMDPERMNLILREKMAALRPELLDDPGFAESVHMPLSPRKELEKKFGPGATYEDILEGGGDREKLLQVPEYAERARREMRNIRKGYPSETSATGAWMRGQAKTMWDAIARGEPTMPVLRVMKGLPPLEEVQQSR